MSEPDDATDSVSALQTAVITALNDRADTLDPLKRICRACTQLLPVDGASVSLMTGAQHRETLYASDPVIERIEALQFTLGEGPCFEAFHTDRPVLVPDLAEASTGAWPVFAAQVAEEHVAAIFAFPLHSGAARFGAIDMYRRTAGWLRPAELSTALQVADIATTALLGPDATGGVPDEGWFTALPANREAVHQATGMLIAEFGIAPEQALARLRGYAFVSGRLVDDVAADLVTRQLHPADIDDT